MYLYPFIKDKFTSGPDGISANIIKLSKHELVKPITHLINSYFE